MNHPVRLTQHAAGHQDVEERLCIAPVVELSASGIEELCDRFQIRAALIQALYDTFLKQSRVKSFLFICGKIFVIKIIKKTPVAITRQHKAAQTSFPRFEPLASERRLLLLLITHKRHPEIAETVNGDFSLVLPAVGEV